MINTFSLRLAPEAIIDDVIEYPEMLMARTGLNSSLALGAKANIMIQSFIIFVEIFMNNEEKQLAAYSIQNCHINSFSRFKIRISANLNGA